MAERFFLIDFEFWKAFSPMDEYFWQAGKAAIINLKVERMESNPLQGPQYCKEFSFDTKLSYSIL